jgi:hypothetical protein
LDKFSDVERILQQRIRNDSESIEAPEGNWAATITVDPGPDLALPNFPIRVTYRVALSPEVNDRIDQSGREPVLDDFRSLSVQEYRLKAIAPPSSDRN